MRATIVLASLTLIAAAGCGGDSATEVTGAPTATSAPVESTAVEDAAGEAPWPDPVGYHEAVYDVGSGSVLIVGGCSGPECTPVDRAWSLDPVEWSWTDRSVVPPGVAGGALAHDAGSEATVALQVAFDDVANDPVGTWVFDRAANEWNETGADPQPRLGAGARMVYDAESDRLIAFGGVGVSDGELVWTEGTWAYDVDTNTWTDMQPAVAPPPVNFFAFSYDAESDRAVLFGLRPGAESLLWTYDYDSNTWEELERTGGPEPAPAYGRSFYHAPTDRIIYVGGTGPAESDRDAVDLVWAFDLNTNSWEDLGPADVLGPIGWHTLTYVESVDRAIVFGGGPTYDEYFGDRLVAYQPTDDTWSEVLPE